MKSSLPGHLMKVRHDLSEWLWHFCRRDGDPLATLQAILASRYIKGGIDPYCQERAVCLTETPLAEASCQSLVLQQRGYDRISEYGVGFKKSWVFAQGGLPVIYQPASMRGKLPPEMKWRHCDLDFQKGIDFTWQREWRVPGSRLEFSDEDVVVVVPTEKEALYHLCSGHEIDFERDEFYFDVDWTYVTFESLRNSDQKHDIEMLKVKKDEKGV